MVSATVVIEGEHYPREAEEKSRIGPELAVSGLATIQPIKLGPVHTHSIVTFVAEKARIK